MYVVIKKIFFFLPKEVTCDFIDRLPTKDFPTIQTAVVTHLKGQLQMTTNYDEV
jgi:hypothetical protein